MVLRLHPQVTCEQKNGLNAIVDRSSPMHWSSTDRKANIDSQSKKLGAKGYFVHLRLQKSKNVREGVIQLQEIFRLYLRISS